jgi:hypothetical protein
MVPLLVVAGSPPAVQRPDIGAPAAEGRDLPPARAQERLAEHAEHDGAVGEQHLADGKTRRFVQQHLRQPRRRHVPDLERDARALARRRAQHRRMPVVDRVEAIAGVGLVLAHEARADGEQVRIQLESAHQGAVDGQQYALRHVVSIQVPVSPRSARSMFSALVMTPRPPTRPLTNLSKASIFGPMLPAPKCPSAA